MKVIIFILPFMTGILYGQVVKLDSVILKRKQFECRIDMLKDSIRILDSIIVFNSVDRISFNENLSFIKTTTREGAKLRLNPNPYSELLMTIEPNKEIKVYDFYSNYLGVCVDSICEYLNDVWVNVNDSLKRFIQYKQEVYQTKIRYQEELDRIKVEKDKVAYEKKLLLKYGKAVYEKLKHGVYWIGMTDEMALIALGYPDDINRTVGYWGVHEQWV